MGRSGPESTYPRGASVHGGFKTERITDAQNLSDEELAATREAREEARQALADGGCK